MNIQKLLIKLSTPKGQTLLEVAIVLGGAIFVVTTITALVLAALVNAQFSKNQKVGSQFAQEGMEVVRRFRDADFNAFFALSNASGTHCSGNTCTYCLNKNSTELLPKNNLAQSGCAVNAGDPIENVDTYARLVKIEKNSSSCGAANLIKATVTVEWSDGRCTTQGSLCRSVEITSCLSNVSSYYAVLLPTPTPTPTGIPTPTPTPTPTLTPSPTQVPVICTCDVPGGTMPINRFTCTDGSNAYCATSEYCTTSAVRPAFPCAPRPASAYNNNGGAYLMIDGAPDVRNPQTNDFTCPSDTSALGLNNWSSGTYDLRLWVCQGSTLEHLYTGGAYFDYPDDAGKSNPQTGGHSCPSGTNPVVIPSCSNCTFTVCKK